MVWHHLVRALLVVIVLGCASDRPPPQPIGEPHTTTPRPVPLDATTAPDAAAPLDATAPVTLAAALAELRARGAETLADVIAKRVAQSSPKMQLAPDAARGAALASLAILERAHVRELIAVMPRSTVELARATAERGVPLDELDRITAYLVRVVAAIQPERLATFDDNHSHVTGRDWHEIDYSGESMTWEGQRDAWTPKGVESFKRAAFIHAYFVGAERLAHWAKVYKPRGKMAAVTPP